MGRPIINNKNSDCLNNKLEDSPLRGVGVYNLSQ